MLDLSDVKKIEVVNDKASANDLLERGWALLLVDTVQSGDTKHVTYIFGWKRVESEENINQFKEQYGF